MADTSKLTTIGLQAVSLPSVAQSCMYWWAPAAGRKSKVLTMSALGGLSSQIKHLGTSISKHQTLIIPKFGSVSRDSFPLGVSATLRAVVIRRGEIVPLPLRQSRPAEPGERRRINPSEQAAIEQFSDEAKDFQLWKFRGKLFRCRRAEAVPFGLRRQVVSGTVCRPAPQPHFHEAFGAEALHRFRAQRFAAMLADFGAIHLCLSLGTTRKAAKGFKINSNVA